MKWEKPSHILAFAGWLSVFVLSWLLILGYRPLNWLSAGFWFFFLIIAILASAVGSDGKGH